MKSRLGFRDLLRFVDGIADYVFRSDRGDLAGAELADSIRRSVRRGLGDSLAGLLTTPAIAVVLVSHDLDDAPPPFS